MGGLAVGVSRRGREVPTEHHQRLLTTLKRVTYELDRTEIPYALAGGFAVYARGGSVSDHDVDFLIRESDVEEALAALSAAGFRTERPPEGWLVKAFDGDILVDLIFRPVEQPVTEATLADVDALPVNAVHVPVISATRLLTHLLLTFTEHSCDFAAALPSARSLREQVDWASVRADTADSPYAAAFLLLLERLNIISDRIEVSP